MTYTFPLTCRASSLKKFPFKHENGDHKILKYANKLFQRYLTSAGINSSQCLLSESILVSHRDCIEKMRLAKKDANSKKSTISFQIA